MITKYYVDGGGKYLGGFSGAEPPAGSFEVPTAPVDARCVWNGAGWLDAPIPVEEKRSFEYDKRGVTIDKMVVALWEKVVESRPEAADALQVIREQVKTDLSKPE